MPTKHETPTDLDYLFERDLISPDDYKAFWIAYYNEPFTGVDDLLDRFNLIMRKSGSRQRFGERLSVSPMLKPRIEVWSGKQRTVFRDAHGRFAKGTKERKSSKA